MTQRNPTIRTVANAAGVSTATVSRALNGGKIAESTQRNIEAVIERLGYRRNVLARGLVTGRTGVLGVLIPDVVGPLYAQMARGVEDVLEPAGMHFMMVTDNRDPEHERRSIELLLQRQVDGIVIIGSKLEAEDMADLLRDGPPAVHIQREAASAADAFCTIDIDNRSGTVAAVRHLISMGHRDIAHVAGVRRDGQARLASFREAMVAAGLDPVPVIQADSTEEGGYRAGIELMEHPTVTAVYCANDRMALGLYHALKSSGIRIPADVSVVGFDDLPWGAYVDPPLTTVRQPGREMGRIAAEKVLAALNGDGTPRMISVAAELVERASVELLVPATALPNPEKLPERST